jgi:tRNA pseudouridine55 synthase
MARDRIDGVLVLDKPVGPSSAQALGRTRWLMGAAKAGHGGTLDPLASGLLPVLFGEATKFSDDLLRADKAYEACVRLGISTTTADAEGEWLTVESVPQDEALIRRASAEFVGSIIQVPPAYSAIKKDGRPLYEYARAGIAVEVPSREVQIHALDVLRIELGEEGTIRDVWIRVDCSKGTYIRTLAADLGSRLGCGGHLAALRRTRVGDLTIEQSISLDGLEALADRTERRACLAPVDSLLSSVHRIDLDTMNAERFCHGQLVPIPIDIQLQSESTTIPRLRIYGDNRLLGLAVPHAGMLKPLRLMSTAPSPSSH